MAALPRRQELPEDACWTFDELVERLGTAERRVKVLMLPRGLENALDEAAVESLVDALDQWIDHFGATYEWELGIFLDRCSLCQDPRSQPEQKSYELALQNLHLWYLSQWTDVWLSPGTAWAEYERALSAFSLKSDGAYCALVLDLGNFDGQCASWEVTEATCAVDRSVPLVPALLAEAMPRHLPRTLAVLQHSVPATQCCTAQPPRSPNPIKHRVSRSLCRRGLGIARVSAQLSPGPRLTSCSLATE